MQRVAELVGELLARTGHGDARLLAIALSSAPDHADLPNPGRIAVLLVPTDHLGDRVRCVPAKAQLGVRECHRFVIRSGYQQLAAAISGATRNAFALLYRLATGCMRRRSCPAWFGP